MPSQKWTIAEVRRAVRAVEKAGKVVGAVDFPESGGFRILLGETGLFDISPPNASNEWDDVLPR